LLRQTFLRLTEIELAIKSFKILPRRQGSARERFLLSRIYEDKKPVEHRSAIHRRCKNHGGY
jgi:hypothetical protein